MTLQDDNSRRHRRPRTMDEMRNALRGFNSDKSYRRALEFTPLSSDIFIAPYAKCGTTWMQQIVHGLRTGGATDFEEISEVIPWLEMGYDLGIDPNSRQTAHPRAFKTHLTWEEIPKGARYIIVFRDPVDAMVSMHRFLEGWVFEEGSIPLDTFVSMHLLHGGGGWWDHAVSWWNQYENTDVLMVTYEFMKLDLPTVVDKVANFIDPSIGQATRSKALKQAGFSFMKQHERKFDDHILREHRDAACGLPPGGHASKVHLGQTGEGSKNLPADVLHAFDRRWGETMTRSFGLPDYHAFRAAVAARLRKSDLDPR